jgi:hypothetical protein
MNDLAEIIRVAESWGATFTVHGEHVKLIAPRRLPAELIACLRKNKADLRDYLQARAALASGRHVYRFRRCGDEAWEYLITPPTMLRGEARLECERHVGVLAAFEPFRPYAPLN